jgi:RES domain-containing protein
VRFDAMAQFGLDLGEGRNRVGARWNRRVHPDILRARADEARAFGAPQLEACEE